MSLIRDIKNYAFILKQIRAAKKTKEWTELGLSTDWVGRVWVVLHLREEDLGEADLVLKARLTEKTKKYNTFMKNLDVHEIVFPSLDQKSQRSFLLVYSPLFNTISSWYVLSRVTVISLLIWIILHFSLISKLINLF